MDAPASLIANCITCSINCTGSIAFSTRSKFVLDITYTHYDGQRHLQPRKKGQMDINWKEIENCLTTLNLSKFYKHVLMKQQTVLAQSAVAGCSEGIFNEVAKTAVHAEDPLFC